MVALDEFDVRREVILMDFGELVERVSVVHKEGIFELCNEFEIETFVSEKFFVIMVESGQVADNSEMIAKL